MKVSFRCKQSGNVVNFTNQQDIDWMRKEAGYEEIKNEVSTKADAEITTKQEIREGLADNPDESYNAENAGQGNDGQQKDAKVLKKRGRPRSIEQDVI